MKALLGRSLIGLSVALSLASCGDGGSYSIKSNSSEAASGNNSNGLLAFGLQQREKVLNGTEQPESGSPQMVRLELLLGDGSTATCSGVVIAPGKVLTAGHCTTVAKQITVFTQGAAYAATGVALAPGYAEVPALNAVFNDAAVVTVNGLAAPALPIIASIPISTESALLVFGFGLDESGGSGVLKFGSTKASVVTPNHIFGEAFSGGNVDPCFGDSGGPLLASVTRADGSSVIGIVGVVSTGTNSSSDSQSSSCNPGDVTLYTNLQNQGLLAFLQANASGIAIF